MSGSPAFPIEPRDEQNERLIANVRPLDWINPTPAPKYNLVVIGAGAAGLVTAIGAAGLGAKVALIEKHLLGGDCLNVGCVPSKTIIRSSRAARDIRDAASFGVSAGDPRIDFARVMERVRRVRADISKVDAAARYRDLGVDVFIGTARFSAPDAIDVDGRTLRFSRAVIAAGARPATPPIPGLAEAGFLTNETVFNITRLPRRLAVLGGGPIGCELAQAFRRLGSEVTIVEAMDQFLLREDPDAARLLLSRFQAEGIDVRLGTKLSRVASDGDGKALTLDRGGVESILNVDEILVGVGRKPNVDTMNLEAARVAYDPRTGVKVDDALRTSNKRIFAAGDICMEQKFTHAADAAARIVIQNALFFGSKKLSALQIPRCTYTDPEIAAIGLTESMAAERGIAIDTYRHDLAENDRAMAEGETDGFVKVRVKKGTDEIVGATIVARHAGEMIGEITTAMVHGIGLGGLASVIHPYPTQAEAIKRAADAYNRTRFTPSVAKWFRRFLAWRR
ncbi:mercuric reductase [bacterium]|nr:mercuric reductase [bacterium]